MSNRKLLIISLIIFLTSCLANSSLIQNMDKLNPPLVLYHFGEREALLKDVAEKTIPNDIWLYIMESSQGAYESYPSYRRGLYGVSHPGYAEIFGDRVIYNKKGFPWFLIIDINSKCLKANNISRFYKPLEDKKFLDWFKKQNFPTEVSASLANCITGQVNAADNTCSETLNRYFNDEKNNIKVIWDTAFGNPLNADGNLSPKSWYIRDRNCFKIRGTSEEIISTAATLPHYFDTSIEGTIKRFNTIYAPSASTSVLIVLKALEELPNLSKRMSADLRAAVQRSDIFYTDHDKLFSIGKPWIPEVLLPVIDLIDRCQSQNTPHESSTFLESVLTKVSDLSFQNQANNSMSPLLRQVADGAKNICITK